ncbi:MAG: hypothetical protein KF802_02010 [Bdellovibrionaceae bacterium]|nr:hypothetical protein [Pseudobdellovibrionaceae bacterium]MBX3033908.1 hypothetical protein [Pseudobdellovibrionaceae bacterium]
MKKLLMSLVVAFGLPAWGASKKADAVTCVRAGCSGELCLTTRERDDMMSTCVWREEFACRKLMDCAADAKGGCELKATEASKECEKKLPKGQNL